MEADEDRLASSVGSLRSVLWKEKAALSPETLDRPPPPGTRRQSLPCLRRPSILYEENMPVVVRRRGVTMTVRIFGAEEEEGDTEPESARQEGY
jgi:hypothetical protein